MMRLYWSPRTRSLRALWMLEETGVAYERVLVDIGKGGQDDPAFRRINPMGKVPAFEDGTAQLAESAAICAYIAERVPEAGLAPAVGDPLRGRYFHWLFFAPGCIEPAMAQKFVNFELPSSAAAWGDFNRVFNVLEGFEGDKDANDQRLAAIYAGQTATPARSPRMGRARMSVRPPAPPPAL